MIKFKEVGDGYICLEDYTYYSKRYKKYRTVKKGEYSDGATGAPDGKRRARGWWIHDMLCRYGCWDDGSKCSNWQASTVLYDILREDGCTFIAPYWRFATFLLGGGAARDKKTYTRE